MNSTEVRCYNTMRALEAGFREQRQHDRRHRGKHGARRARDTRRTCVLSTRLRRAGGKSGFRSVALMAEDKLSQNAVGN